MTQLKTDIPAKKSGRGGWRGGGRPKKPADQKRIAVQLSLTASERDMIDDSARQAGMTRSAFVVEAVKEKLDRG